MTADGELVVDHETLDVDATDDRVGMGLTTPTTELDVYGSVYTSQNITAGGNVNATKFESGGWSLSTTGSGCNKFDMYSGTISS